MENKGQRKATDVLLDLESKLDIALSIIKSQDLNMKLLSNKLNSLIEKLDKQTIGNFNAPLSKQFIVEAVRTGTPPQFVQPPSEENRQIQINPEYNLPLEKSPAGFRRTSRPETYSGDSPILQKSKETTMPSKIPIQVIKPPPGREVVSEFVAPQKSIKQADILPPSSAHAAPSTRTPQIQTNKGSIPVEQRVVDKDGKSVFLADVEIVDLQTSTVSFKTRTNGAGKWAAPLAVGNYRVTINKRESLTKQKIEIVQDIQVTGSEVPLVLHMMIIK